MFKTSFCLFALLLSLFSCLSDKQVSFFVDSPVNSAIVSEPANNISRLNSIQTIDNKLKIRLNNGDDVIVNLIDYTFYEIKNNPSFGYEGYSADCLKITALERYMPIKILFQESLEGYFLNVSILDTSEKIIYISSSLFSISEFKSLGLVIYNLTDEAKNDILNQESYLFKYPTYYSMNRNNKLIKRASSLQNNNSDNELSELFEDMTSNRKVFDEYNPQDNLFDSNSRILGSNITKFIPEECFKVTGNYSYVGKEYGFVVNTITDGVTLYGEEKHLSFVVLYFIYLTLPGDTNRDNREIVVKVVPETFGIYKHDIYEDDYYWQYNNFSPSVDELIYYYSDAPYVAMANIQFGVSLQNANDSNYGDTDYVSEEDNGDFIIQTRYNYSGCSVAEPNDDYSFLIEDAQIVLSYLPFTKELMNLISMGEDAVKLVGDLCTLLGLPKSSEMYTQKTGDNEVNIIKYPQSALEQRQKYGNLLKTSIVVPMDQSIISTEDDQKEYNPILFKSFEHYAQANILTNYGNNNLPSNETKLTYFIAFDICNQFVVDPIFGTLGDVEYIMSCIGINTAGTYQSTQREISDNEEFKKDYKNGETIRFIYSPNESQRQAISYQTDCDAILKIYKKDKELIKEAQLLKTSELHKENVIDNILFDKVEDYYFEITGFQSAGEFKMTIINSQIIMMKDKQIDVYIDDKHKYFGVCVPTIHNPNMIEGVLERQFTVDKDENTSLNIYDLDGELYSSGTSVKTPSVRGGHRIENDLTIVFYLEVVTNRTNFNLSINVGDVQQVEYPYPGGDFSLIDWTPHQRV